MDDMAKQIADNEFAAMLETIGELEAENEALRAALEHIRLRAEFSAADRVHMRGALENVAEAARAALGAKGGG